MKILVILLLTSILLFSGCLTDDDFYRVAIEKNDPSICAGISDIKVKELCLREVGNKQTIASQNNPQNNLEAQVKSIYGFDATHAGECDGIECIKFWFSFLDVNQEDIALDGTADIEIKNESGETVFQKTFEVNKEDFFRAEVSTSAFSPKVERLIWLGKIPLAEIEKSMLKQEGTIYLAFSLPLGGYFEKVTTTVYELPKYTSLEILELGLTTYSIADVTKVRNLAKECKFDSEEEKCKLEPEIDCTFGSNCEISIKTPFVRAVRQFVEKEEKHETFTDLEIANKLIEDELAISCSYKSNEYGSFKTFVIKKGSETFYASEKSSTGMGDHYYTLQTFFGFKEFGDKKVTIIAVFDKGEEEFEVDLSKYK